MKKKLRTVNLKKNLLVLIKKKSVGANTVRSELGLFFLDFILLLPLTVTFIVFIITVFSKLGIFPRQIFGIKTQAHSYAFKHPYGLA